MKEKIKKNDIKSITLIIVTLVIFNAIYSYISDNTHITNVYYRAKINKIYTKWSKDGKSINTNDKYIDSLDIKVKNKKEGEVLYEIANEDGEFIDEYYKNSKTLDGIYGIRMYLSKILNKKYDICYRTYNEKDKWLDWACDGEISGNKKYKVKNIKIKIIPKNVLKNEYLEGYMVDIKEKSKGF